MSRIGKMSIALPQGVDVKCENSLITVKGPKGTLTREMKGAIEFKTEHGHLTLVAQNVEKETGATRRRELWSGSEFALLSVATRAANRTLITVENRRAGYCLQIESVP